MTRIQRPLRKIALLLVLFLVVEYLVLPEIAGVRKSLSLLSRVNLAFVLAGVVLEAAALLAYAKLTQAFIPAEGRPRFITLLRVDLATLSVSHVVPGGAAAGAGLGYRLLTEAGVRGADAGFALAGQGIGSAIVLNVLLWLGLLISIPLRGFDPLYGTAAIVGVILIGGFSAAVVLLTRGEKRAADAICRMSQRVPIMDGDAINRLLHRVADRVRDLISDRALVRRAIMWAAANWLLDAASLWVFVAAFGYRLGPESLIVSYGVANVLAAIPVTPGGLGVVEAVLTSSLVGFGSPRGIAILGVISYRLVNFWLPIPLGGLAYLSLQVEEGALEVRKGEKLRSATEQVVREAEDPRTWAARHGLKVRKD